MFLTGTRADFGHKKHFIDKCIERGYDASKEIPSLKEAKKKYNIKYLSRIGDIK
jgi:hypothetical protein